MQNQTEDCKRSMAYAPHPAPADERARPPAESQPLVEGDLGREIEHVDLLKPARWHVTPPEVATTAPA